MDSENCFSFDSQTNRLGWKTDDEGWEDFRPVDVHKSASLIFSSPSLQGEPSLCYVFDGDGVCEEFERDSSVQDCGYFTPLGYTDQWAATATASHQDPNRCPAHAATGEPLLTKVQSSMNLTAHKKSSR